MGPKSQNFIAGKETFQRINYLYQATNLLINNESQAEQSASRMCSNLLINISKKAVQRLDVDIKRTICKGCRNMLLAGVSCHVKIRKKEIRWICRMCGTVKKFNIHDQQHSLWSQKPECIEETINFSKNDNSNA